MYQPPQGPNQPPYQPPPGSQMYPQNSSSYIPPPLQASTGGNTIMREFTLIDGTGIRRIQLYQKEKGESIIILLDGATIGSITSNEEFIQGKEFALLDGSRLKVQLLQGQVRVFRNNQPLPAVQPIQQTSSSSHASTYTTFSAWLYAIWHDTSHGISYYT